MTRGRVCAPLTLGALLIVAAGCAGKTEVPRYRCANYVLDQALAPDGGAKAVVFERRCSPGLGFTTQVSLIGSTDPLPDSPGNVFVAGNGGRVSHGRSFVTVAWAGPGKLTVTIPRRVPVYRLEQRVAGIEIVYVAREKDGVGNTQDVPQPRRAR